MTTIQDVATALDRRMSYDTSLVDPTPAGPGWDEAGFSGIARPDEPTDLIGWYDGGGSSGHPVVEIAREDIPLAIETISSVSCARPDMEDVRLALVTAGVRHEWMA